jgi:dynein heavy chain, axonemal
MEDLQRIVENIEPFRTAKDFRMWLTTMSTPDFPQSVLQASVKLTSEPALSLKQNLRNIYKSKDDTALMASGHPGTYRRLLFGVCVPLVICCLAAVPCFPHLHLLHQG